MKALNTIAPQLMVKPGGVSPKISESIQDFILTLRYYFYCNPLDCVGAMYGTHIPATIRGRAVSSYRNRHGFDSQNVLATCNFDLEFIYVLSGWEGSAHDSKVLNDALSRRNGLEVPPDRRFANRRQFLAPLRGVRYHQKNFDGEGRHPRNANELFNLRHSSLRNVVERIFGVFKSRFTIFKVAAPFSFQTQAEFVLACAGLYNFLRKECRSDKFPVESTDDQLSDTDDDIYELNPLSQQQQREETNNWKNKKTCTDEWLRYLFVIKYYFIY
ncbi:hypothetical protein DCAR_0206011 [Daucus carota subsp. sativus]|uniref:DDE Tnp4 domain-containing protein n=1 Tax=Daucus carota subsp. sativus TaxID=79200 RepID=A0AAF0WEH9_DAUCS|nr:hypothetical protein DCAR_0206011 [Daucus carota subsp. sativus]